MELRKAEFISVFHDHHRCIRHVDANLDDRRAHEHIDFACAEALHDLALRCRFHAAVQKSHLISGKCFRLQEFRLSFSRLRVIARKIVERIDIHRLVLLAGGSGIAETRTLFRARPGSVRGPFAPGADQGAHDINLLSPFACLKRHIVGTAAFAEIINLRRARRALEGNLAQIRLRHRAVQRQGKRARNGRRSHFEHIARRALRHKGLTLINAETLFLVDNHEPAIMAHHVAHKKRMRAKAHRNRARSQAFEDRLAFRSRR